MKTLQLIKEKMVEVLKHAYTDVDYSLSWDKVDQHYKKTMELCDEMEALAKSIPTFIGRIVSFPVADGSAYYVVDKISKKTVHVTWIPYLDNYYDDRLEQGGNLDREWTEQKITGMDELKKLFSSRK